MGKNATKTCDICFKTMRGDYLKRHMFKHEKERKSESNKLSTTKIGSDQTSFVCSLSINVNEVAAFSLYMDLMALIQAVRENYKLN